MVQLLSIGIECLSLIVFLIPAMMLLQYKVFRQRSLGKLFMVFVFAFYSMAVFSVTGIPTVYTWRVDFSFHFIPLIDIFNGPVVYMINTVLNIILFMPMGFLLPAIWKEYRSIKKTIVMGLTVSILIELLQIFSFRLTDIDDLITNTLGTFFGYYCGKAVSFRLPFSMPEHAENKSATFEPVIILAAVLLIALILKPFVSNALWDMVLSSSLWERIR